MSLLERRSRRSYASKGAAPPASIHVEFENLPSDSRRKLDDLLQSWAAWHQRTYLPGYLPPDVASGQLSIMPDLLVPENKSVLPVLEDRPAEPTKNGTQMLWFNIQYEKSADGYVPRYDRALGRPLQLAGQKRSAAALEVGSEAGSRAFDALGSDGPRCFNCGSYGHVLSQCWHELDPGTISAAKEEVSGVGQYRTGPKRYFLPGAPEATDAAPEDGELQFPAKQNGSSSTEKPHARLDDDEFIPVDNGDRSRSKDVPVTAGTSAAADDEVPPPPPPPPPPPEPMTAARYSAPGWHGAVDTTAQYVPPSTHYYQQEVPAHPQYRRPPSAQDSMLTPPAGRVPYTGSPYTSGHPQDGWTFESGSWQYSRHTAATQPQSPPPPSQPPQENGSSSYYYVEGYGWCSRPPDSSVHHQQHYWTPPLPPPYPQ